MSENIILQARNLKKYYGNHGQQQAGNTHVNSIVDTFPNHHLGQLLCCHTNTLHGYGTFEVGKDGLFLYLPTCIYTEIYDDPVIYKYSFDVDTQLFNNTAFIEYF